MCRWCGILAGKYLKEQVKHSCGSCSWNNFKAHFVPIDTMLYFNTAPCEETTCTAAGSTGKMAHMGKYNNASHIDDKVVNMGFRFFCIKQYFIHTWKCWDIQRHLSGRIAAPAILHSTIQWEYFLVAIEFVKHMWSHSSYQCTEGLECTLSTNPVLSIIDWWTRNSRTLFGFKWTTDPWSRQSDHSNLLTDSLSDPCITWEV